MSPNPPPTPSLSRWSAQRRIIVVLRVLVLAAFIFFVIARSV